MKRKILIPTIFVIMMLTLVTYSSAVSIDHYVDKSDEESQLIPNTNLNQKEDYIPPKYDNYPIAKVKGKFVQDIVFPESDSLLFLFYLPKMPKTCRELKPHHNVTMWYFEGTISSIEEEPKTIQYKRENETSFFNVRLFSEYSILKITKADGVFYVEGIMYELNVTTYEKIPDDNYVAGEVIVQFKPRMGLFRIFFNIAKSDLKVKEFFWMGGFAVLVGVPEGKEIHWIEQFQSKRYVMFAELNGIIHIT